MKKEEKKPSNPSAYPFQQIEYNEISGNSEKNKEKGMTLRDYFANSAMQGLINNEAEIQRLKTRTEQVNEAIASIAYHMADSMLKQREL